MNTKLPYKIVFNKNFKALIINIHFENGMYTSKLNNKSSFKNACNSFVIKDLESRINFQKDNQKNLLQKIKICDKNMLENFNKVAKILTAALKAEEITSARLVDFYIDSVSFRRDLSGRAAQMAREYGSEHFMKIIDESQINSSLNATIITELASLAALPNTAFDIDELFYAGQSLKAS